MLPIIIPGGATFWGASRDGGHTKELFLMLFLSTKVGVKPVQGGHPLGCGLSALVLLRQWGKHGLGPSP